jgi:glutamate synthase (NADPH/NADH) large chain
MTSGQVVILGDPGPYAFSGMTGGVVYQMLTPMLGFDQAALQRRLARGSSVAIEPLHNGDREALRSLLGHYIKALEQTHQIEVIDHIQELCEERSLEERFVKIVPVLGEAVLQG